MVAQVVAPRGLQGELKCRLQTDFPDRFRPGLLVYAGSPPVQRRVVAARVEGEAVYLTLEGVDDREAAEALRGSEVLIRRADAMPLPPGQYYWSDVVGLRVESPSGEPFGTVVDILQTGANDVYVVHGPRGEILLPATREIVQEISPERGRLVADVPPGLLPETPAPRPARRRARRSTGAR